MSFSYGLTKSPIKYLAIIQKLTLLKSKKD